MPFVRKSKDAGPKAASAIARQPASPIWLCFKPHSRRRLPLRPRGSNALRPAALMQFKSRINTSRDCAACASGGAKTLARRVSVASESEFWDRSKTRNCLFAKHCARCCPPASSFSKSNAIKESSRKRVPGLSHLESASMSVALTETPHLDHMEAPELLTASASNFDPDTWGTAARIFSFPILNVGTRNLLPLLFKRPQDVATPDKRYTSQHRKKRKIAVETTSPRLLAIAKKEDALCRFSSKAMSPLTWRAR
mmetsp:Transcript_33397/g.92234  ORF Transcript_33397/g.92234 Transcript_33397/m.92234 type:complete len:253 (+) Transcript_33397:772-1530(+)